ncbi:MAG: hypothetical protein ACOYEV_06950 [Candidatus Nanopelagicales bacterium]
MKLPHRSAAMVLCAAAVLSAGGCQQGFQGTVNSQQPSGDGTYLSQGGISVQNAILVAGSEPETAALSFTMINSSASDDALQAVTVSAPGTAQISAPIALPASTVIGVGGPNEHQIDLAKFTVPAGSYAEVTFTFQEAGKVAGQLLVVAPAGTYEQYGPKPDAEQPGGDGDSN